MSNFKDLIELMETLSPYLQSVDGKIIYHSMEEQFLIEHMTWEAKCALSTIKDYIKFPKAIQDLRAISTYSEV